MRFSQAFLNKLESGHDKPSFMIALYPSEKTIKQLVKLQSQIEFPAGKEVTTEKDFHLTLRYFRKKDFKKADDSWVYKVQENDPFDKIILVKNKVHIEILGKDNALVLVLDDSELQSNQKKLDELLQKNGIPPSDYPVFKAHITLGYGLDKVPKELPKTLNIPIELDKIKLTDESDKVYYTKDLK